MPLATKCQPLPAEVEQLKAEGNALFVQGNFLLAIDKYTTAIEKIDDNAIIFSNRAACYMGLKRFTDAALDAHEATKLDPTYPKGWGRLGAAKEALGDDVAALRAYKSALSCLPSGETGLSDADKRLKEQYSRSLDSLHRKPITLKKGLWENKMPWDLAKLLPPQPPTSSARVILHAYEEFEEGVKLMGSLQISGGMAFGKTGGLELITNAILADDRVFHIKDQDFGSQYNNYVIFEATRTGAWQDTKGPSDLIHLAKAKLVSSGWDAVRPALSITIRAWIMRAFLIDGIGGLGTTDDAVEWYERTVHALELGRREWPNVDKIHRGVIFEDTFLRGVRVLHLNAYMKATIERPGANSPYPLSRLLEMADAMLAECAAIVRDPSAKITPEFISSFEVYPVGTALSMKGFYHVTLAKRGLKTPEESSAQMGEGGKFYLKAAEMFPEDDERHVWFLRQTLDCLFYSGTKARDTLAMMERIRNVTPKMRKIWLNSALGTEGRDSSLNKALEIEETLRRQLAEGKFTLEDKVMPLKVAAQS